MFWSTFIRYMNETKGRAPKAIWDKARQLGVDRWKDQLQQGYATEPLVFDDLIKMVENSIVPK